jgi:serine/threonine protein kinase
MEPLHPDDPQWVGPYRLLRRLGAGGMGQVYLGRTAGGRHVAIKMVRGEYAADPQFRHRFGREVAAARGVGGHWTAPVLDADTEGPHPWVATGYIPGPSLSSAVGEFGPLPRESIRVLGVGLAEALLTVHHLGLVHRDVKPANVLLALDGPRLIDFGIARALDGATALTQSGLVIGSPGYMSPEQAGGRRSGPPSDVFSLGAVLAYAATGVSPFGAGVSVPVLIYRVLHEEPDLAGLHGDLRDLVRTCLDKDPAQRPTPSELRDRLHALEGGAIRLGQQSWLPPTITDAVGRMAVALLDLDDPGIMHASPTRPGPPPTTDSSTRPGPPPSRVVPAGSSSAFHRNRWLPVALAAMVTAAVVGTFVWLSGILGPSHARPDPTPDPRAPRSAASSSGPPDASGSDVPERFLGTWSGYLTSPLYPGARAALRITIRKGRIGDVIASLRTQSPSGGICDGTDTLESAGPNQLTLQTRTITGPSCLVPETAPQIYTSNSPTSLHLQVEDASADLAKI